MSYATGTGIYGPYSSSSDIEGIKGEYDASGTEYSDIEAGYSSATSNFDFSGTSGFPSQRVPPYARYGARPASSSQSPPSMPVQQAQLYSNMESPTATPISGQSLSGHPDHMGNGPSSVGSQKQTYQRIARFVGPPPVALACTECRARHLKCDAGTPQCSRCLTDKRECNYVKSRRGWKGTRRKKVAAAAAASENERSRGHDVSGTDTEGPGPEPSNNHSQARPPPTPTSSSGSIPRKHSTAPPVPPANFTPPTAGPHTDPLESVRTHHKNTSNFPSQQEPESTPSANTNLMQLYYSYFHPAHPFCLPPSFLIKRHAQELTVLLPVMRYVASFFSKQAAKGSFLREAEHALFGGRPAPAKSSFTVQALLLFAIGLHSDNEQDRAAQVKDFAAELALELGMNHKEFSENTGGEGEGGRVLEESWRRTWWELYYLDGLLAGIHQRDGFKLWSVECTVPLPCEEADYFHGRIPEPHSLQEFDERYFAGESTVFSSFAYRVEAVRIMGQVLAANIPTTTQDEAALRLDAADSSIVNWGLHLPQVKKELVDKAGKVDEMLFQAHMVIAASIIYLHRPKSHLAISLIPDDTVCTPPAQWAPSTKPIGLHTSKTITAANTISKLITLPTPLIKHSPFFTCFIVLASVVHLSACSWLLTGDEGFLAKERTRLGVGALKRMEEVWGIASFVLQQVKHLARDVFKLPPPDGSIPAQEGMSEEDVLRFLEEERAMDGSPIVPDPEFNGLPSLEWEGSGSRPLS